MNCLNCGAEIESDAHRCRVCDVLTTTGIALQSTFMDRIRGQISPGRAALAAPARNSVFDDMRRALTEQHLEILKELADEASGLQLDELQQSIELMQLPEREPESQPFRYRYTMREVLWKLQAIANVAAARGRGASLEEMQDDFCAG